MGVIPQSCWPQSRRTSRYDYTREATNPLVQAPGDWFSDKLTSALGFLLGLPPGWRLHWTVMVTEEEFIYDGKRLFAGGNNVQLNANVFDTDTTDGEATYTWESPIRYCPIMVSKTISGLLVEDEHTKFKVFMNIDNSLVRLVLSFQ